MIKTFATNQQKPLKNEDGLTSEDSKAITDFNRRFINLVVIYHETDQVPWVEKRLEVGEASKEVDVKDSPCP